MRKRIFVAILLVLNLLCLSGCGGKKDNFSFYKDKISNISGYKSYVITQQIYNSDLLLYENKKSTYIDNENCFIKVNVKKLDEIDSDSLYIEDESEYYRSGSNFYYYEDETWKIKEVEVENDVGLNIEKSYFEEYTIKESAGKYSFEGNFKEETIDDFFGVSLSDVNDLKIEMEIDGSEKVKNIFLSYIGENGNLIKILVEFDYSASVKFTLPSI